MPEAWKPQTGQKITKIYAWISEEDDGGEGILGMQFGNMWVPMIGADKARIESFRNQAVQIAEASNQPVFLKVFQGGEIIDEI